MRSIKSAGYLCGFVTILCNAAAMGADATRLMPLLYANDVVQIGSFILKSGEHSSVYIDMRNAYSSPFLMKELAREALSTITAVTYDRLCPVPYGAVPLATSMSLISNKPLILPRKELKNHGTGKHIEGIWRAGEKVLLVEDVITTGQSIRETLEIVEAAGLVVRDIVVFLDREQGGVQQLEAQGYQVHAMMKLSDLVAYQSEEK
jgi:uridine monophosphate synthetase